MQPVADLAEREMGRQERHQAHLGRGEVRSLAAVERRKRVERPPQLLRLLGEHAEIGAPVEDLVDLGEQRLRQGDVAERDEGSRKLQAGLHGEPGNRVGEERRELQRVIEHRTSVVPVAVAKLRTRCRGERHRGRRRSVEEAARQELRSQLARLLVGAGEVVCLLGDEHPLARGDRLRLAEAEASGTA